MAAAEPGFGLRFPRSPEVWNRILRKSPRPSIVRKVARVSEPVARGSEELIRENESLREQQRAISDCPMSPSGHLCEKGSSRRAGSPNPTKTSQARQDK